MFPENFTLLQSEGYLMQHCFKSSLSGLRTATNAQPAPFREYVIVHELLHLKVPNHGKLFKTLLRAYLPDYESIRPLPPLDFPVAGRTL